MIKYVGTRPFRLDRFDTPLRYGDTVDESHQYWKNRDSLLARADFVECQEEEEDLTDG